MTGGSGGRALLSFDGGGIGVLSSLLILREIMFRIQRDKGLSDLPLPCDYFHLISGCGFGGLAAIMLGRLRMPINTAIEEFDSITKSAFSTSKWKSMDYRTSKLEKAIDELVGRYVQEGNTRMMNLGSAESACKVFVCVALGHNLHGIERLRTYLGTKQQAPNYTIKEAMLATTAIHGIFQPRTLSEATGLCLTYVAADLVCSNPTPFMLEEARDIFAKEHISCIVSLGSGEGQIPTVLDAGSNPIKDSDELVEILGRIAKDSEMKAQEMDLRFAPTINFYFRFSVEHGMQLVEDSDYRQAPAILAHTRTYLSSVDHIDPSRLDNLAKSLVEKTEYISSSHLVGTVPASSRPCRIQPPPPPSPNFVGRAEVLNVMHEYFTTTTGVQRAFVLCGLGGSGKTQIARMFISKYRALFSEVYYIDASSAQTIESEFKNIAGARTGGQHLEDAFYYFKTNFSNWIIIYDNADDDRLDLRGRYVPHCAHGSLVITTRNRKLIAYSRGLRSSYEVSGMSSEDASELLLRVAKQERSELASSKAFRIVEALGFHALAITQTAAYILVQDYTLDEYLGICLRNCKVSNECLSAVVPVDDDYGQATFSTWMLSYHKLTSETQELLHYLSFMHHTGITEDMFRAAHNQYYSRESDFIQTGSLASFLSKFNHQVYVSNAVWDSSAFRDVMLKPRSYFLIEYDRHAGIYSIHPLVQQWMRKLAPPNTVDAVAELLSLCVNRKYEVDDFAFRRTLLPHIDALPESHRMGENTAQHFSLVYDEAGRWDEAEQLEMIVFNSRKESLGETHPDTLSSLHILGDIYRKKGLWNKAENIFLHVLEARRTLFAESAKEILESEHKLSLVYLDQGKWELARSIEEKALKKRQQIFQEGDYMILESMTQLAWAYWGLKRYADAQPLEEYVLESRTRQFSRTHPLTLESIHNLGKTYMALGLLKQAEALTEEAFQSRSRVLGENHPGTLLTMGSLAIIYLGQDKLDEAEKLQKKVVDAYAQTLNEDHPHTLDARLNLAIIYTRRKEWSRAEGLLTHVIRVQQALPEFDNHPMLFIALDHLAHIYVHQGILGEACRTMEEVVRWRKNVLGEHSSDTLHSVRLLTEWQSWLAEPEEKPVNLGKDIAKSPFSGIIFSTICSILILILAVSYM